MLQMEHHSYEPLVKVTIDADALDKNDEPAVEPVNDTIEIPFGGGDKKTFALQC
jgi:hypothetical protein